MKIFVTKLDLKQLDPKEEAYAVVKNHLERMADLYPDNGYLVLVERTDMGGQIVLPERTLNLASVCWEGVFHFHSQEHYEAVLLLDNEFGIVVLVPNADWLPALVKENLEKHLI